MDNTKVNNSSSALTDYSIDKKQPAKSKEMGQDVFLKLMIAQLKNQDPSNPTDSQSFLTQLAQFNQVSGITSMQATVDKLATSLQSSQALQASTLVGRNVLAESDSISVAKGKPQLSLVELQEGVGNLSVTIKNSKGETVRDLSLGEQKAGNVEIHWDGKDAKGKLVPDGVYSISAASTIDDKNTAHSTFIQAQVGSVTLPRDGSNPILNVAGLGAISLDKVKQVM